MEPNEKSQFRILYKRLLLLVILNGSDYIITMFALIQGASEGNPIAWFFISHGSLPYYKIVGLVMVSFILIRMAKRNINDRLIALKILKWANLGYGLIVVYNLMVLFFQTTQ